MRTWSIPASAPVSLSLAADARSSATDYADDQIWELGLEGGNPPALAIQTSYGRRAHSMRIFVAVSIEGRGLSDPGGFPSPVSVVRLAPNYLQIDFSPSPGLNVSSEYWVTDSHSLAGRVTLRTPSAVDMAPRFILHAILRPDEGGATLTPAVVAGVTILTGRTGGLVPVVFLAGGAAIEKSPYPGLAVPCPLAPGSERSLVWAEAARCDLPSSFADARAAAGRPWDAELARLEQLNESTVEFTTGDPDWDAALTMAQKVAVGSFLGPTHASPQPALVGSRTPDMGHSAIGDGTDYEGGWEAQDAGRAYLALQALTTCAPQLAKGVVLNFLASQAVDGTVDWKVGLSGRRHPAMCVPLLASIAWRIYQDTLDLDFLRHVFHGLLKFVERWFASDHDRDKDNWPEWDTAVQAMLDDNPTFVNWHAWGQGVDTTCAETQDLAAYLVHESAVLLQMAEVLGETGVTDRLSAHAVALRTAVESQWDGQRALYRHRDSATHASPQGAVLGKGQGAFDLAVGRAFDPPVRLTLRCRGPEVGPRSIDIAIRGQGASGRGRIERLTQDDFHWFWGYGTATTNRAYRRIEAIEVRGPGESFETEAAVADFSRQDLSQLLPLWAGIPSAARAERLVRRTLLDPARYWRTFGLPACSAADPAYRSDRRGGPGGISMLWNVMLGEALVNYGYRDQAASLLTRLMAATIGSLRTDHAFRSSYNPDSLEGLGDLDDVAGLAPVGLMLRVLGVRLHTPRKVHVEGGHVFPWPVTLRWRGLEVRREPGRTRVTFPNGETFDLEGEEPRVIEQLD